MNNQTLPVLPTDDQRAVDDLVRLMIRDQRIRTEVTRASHMWFFLTYLAEYVRYSFAPFHREMFALSEDSSIPLLVLMAFRGSAKSTLFTLSYPIWAILGQQRKKFIVILGQTQQQARQYLANLKRELERNGLLRQDLGPFEEREEEWNAGSIVIPKYDARITAISCEQGIRGLRHGAFRPDLIICDDLEDLSSVKTHESRTRTYQWLMGDVIPAGDTHTKVVVIGNMLHEDSLLVRLKREIENKTRDGVFRAFPFYNADGAPSWSGKFSTAEEVLALQRLVGDDVAWSREFLLQIISDAEQVVHPDWIKRYSGEAPTAADPRYSFTGVGIDLAISQKETADYTAMVCARLVDNVMYVLPDPVNERLTFPDTIERVKALHAVFGPRERRNIYVEDVGYQAAVIQQLNKDGIRVEGVNPHGQDKRARIALTTHHIKTGRILFPERGAEELIRQLVGFGKETHDDLADAFTILALKYSDFLNRPIPRLISLDSKLRSRYDNDVGWHPVIEGRWGRRF